MNDFLFNILQGSVFVPNPYFRHRGKRYRLRRAGIRTLSLLNDIATNPAYQSTAGLLQSRRRIRRSLVVPAPVALSYLLDRTRNTRVLRIAMWMLGRIGSPYPVISVARHANHADFRVRREAIRCLHRLHAWSELRRIAATHQDPRTQTLAEPKESRPYTDRLGKYVARSKVLEQSTVPRYLVIATGVEIGSGRPPKSRWRIRAVLRRIRRLVRRSNRGRWPFQGRRRQPVA